MNLKEMEILFAKLISFLDDSPIHHKAMKKLKWNSYHTLTYPPNYGKVLEQNALHVGAHALMKQCKPHFQT